RTTTSNRRRGRIQCAQDASRLTCRSSCRGRNAHWAAHSDVTQLLPRPIAAPQLTLAADASQLRRPELKHAPTPSVPAEAIEPLVAEASELLGRQRSCRWLVSFEPHRAILASGIPGRPPSIGSSCVLE